MNEINRIEMVLQECFDRNIKCSVLVATDMETKKFLNFENGVGYIEQTDGEIRKIEYRKPQRYDKGIRKTFGPFEYVGFMKGGQVVIKINGKNCILGFEEKHDNPQNIELIKSLGFYRAYFAMYGSRYFAIFHIDTAEPLNNWWEFRFMAYKGLTAVERQFALYEKLYDQREDTEERESAAYGYDE